MKTESKPVIEYFHRGRVERGNGRPGYDWHEGYSANSEDGKPLAPWMTRMECMKDARAQGKTARFNYGNLEERAISQPSAPC